MAFTARIIEAFFDLLHSSYPGDGGSTLRDHVGARLEEALEAETQSVDRLLVTGRDQLIECSRRTSILPFQIIEHLATGDHSLLSSTAGTLLGEAMWRIDDLVDLAEDASLNALNAVLLAATEETWPVTAPDAVSALEKVFTSHTIAVAAAQAAECLDAGLKSAPAGWPQGKIGGSSCHSSTHTPGSRLAASYASNRDPEVTITFINSGSSIGRSMRAGM